MLERRVTYILHTVRNIYAFDIRISKNIIAYYPCSFPQLNNSNRFIKTNGTIINVIYPLDYFNKLIATGESISYLNYQNETVFELAETTESSDGVFESILAGIENAAAKVWSFIN